MKNPYKLKKHNILDFFSQIGSYNLIALWLKFRNIPLVKLWLKSLIIGSLLLIITKLIFGEYLNLWSRILLLSIYVGIAMWFNLREKIKIPLTKALLLCLGHEFYGISDDLEKADYLINSFPKDEESLNYFEKAIYTIKFECIWFMQYLCQRLYIGITYIRLFFDINPIIYMIMYYNIFFVVIYNNAAYIMSYIGLFFIFTKLFSYISENNFSEVVNTLTCTGYNNDLQFKKLKFIRQNVMLFMFWNIRNLELGNTLLTTEELKELYGWGTLRLRTKNLKYNFCPDFFEEIPFIYTKHIFLG